MSLYLKQTSCNYVHVILCAFLRTNPVTIKGVQSMLLQWNSAAIHEMSNIALIFIELWCNVKNQLDSSESIHKFPSLLAITYFSLSPHVIRL
jgi:hypothetical protein